MSVVLDRPLSLEPPNGFGDLAGAGRPKPAAGHV